MRKSVITIATLVLFAGISAPAAAFADDEDNDSSWSNYFGDGKSEDKTEPVKKPHQKTDKDNKERHNEIENQFDDYTGVVIPPIVIKPDNRPDPNIFELPVGPDPDADLDLTQQGIGANSVDSAIDILYLTSDVQQDFSTTQLVQRGSSVPSLGLPTSIDPNKNMPIQIRNLVLTPKTPTDEFMQDATVFGGILGSTAIGLLALAGFNTLRLRKDPKANYIYEAKD